MNKVKIIGKIELPKPTSILYWCTDCKKFKERREFDSLRFGIQICMECEMAQFESSISVRTIQNQNSK